MLVPVLLLACALSQVSSEPLTTTPPAAVTAVLESGSESRVLHPGASGTEVPAEDPSITDGRSEELTSTERPSKEAVTTEAPSKEAVTTEGPSEGPITMVTSEGPSEEPTSTKGPSEEPDSPEEQDVSLDQVIAALDGFYRSAGRAATAGPLAELAKSLAELQSGLSAVSSRLELIHDSQLEQRRQHTDLETRLGAIEQSQVETAERLEQSQAETVKRLEQSQAETVKRLEQSQAETVERLEQSQAETVSLLDSIAQGQAETASRLDRLVQSQSDPPASLEGLTQLHSEVSNQFDAVQDTLGQIHGLQHWRNATSSRLASLSESQSGLSSALDAQFDAAEVSRTALSDRMEAALLRSAAANNSSAAVQDQLAAILAAVDHIPRIVLGQQCSQRTDCSRQMPEATCAGGVCVCRDGYRRVSDFRCRQHSRLAEPCLEHADCQSLASNASCTSDRCACDSGFWNHNNTECRLVSAVNMDGSCLGDQDCDSNLHLECTSGTCSCITRTIDSYEYRLDGGSSCAEGNVQLRQVGGSWGLVCDDSWGSSDALVICKSLGFRSGIAKIKSTFGRGANFFMDNVECRGSESALINCNYLGWKRHNCGAGEVAGVRCTT
ncbi:dynactin subunit 1-like [Amphibalanus amphitrite]|uniref:dynactin subunit 1-like n=1 Tax=Amphibalanus amphitrite TaxID=1232801 RepID=UPI001C91F805|nr:dynactin subunit 1-like [Amphibalanus amphitrite]